MNNKLMTQILDRIKAYNRIIIFRHKRPDGDAVGSTLGLRGILRASFPEKEVYVINTDYSDYVSFLGEEDAELDDELYREALGIAIDTATTERLSNPRFTLCKELVKIDHHIDVAPYGDLSWVEDERSSASEMIAEFYAAFHKELKIDIPAATAIYAGMVTDSGRFRFREVSGRTMLLAGMLLELGIDTDTLYSRLYVKDYNTLAFQAYVYNHMKRTANGVLYLLVDKKMQRRFELTGEQASNSVSYMEGIRDCLIWLAIIENDDGSFRVRLRSRFVTVNPIAEKYNGGGHACASGATVYSKKEMNALIGDADARLKEYKESNEGWL